MRLVKKILATTLALMSTFTVVKGDGGNDKIKISTAGTSSDSELVTEVSGSDSASLTVPFIDFQDKIYSRMYVSGIICNYYIAKKSKRPLKNYLKNTKMKDIFRYLFSVLEGVTPADGRSIDEALDSLCVNSKVMKKIKFFMSKKINFECDLVGTRKEVDVTREYGPYCFTSEPIVSLFFRCANSCVLKNFKEINIGERKYKLTGVTVYRIAQSPYAILYEKHGPEWYCHTFGGAIVKVSEKIIDQICSNCPVSIDLTYEEV